MVDKIDVTVTALFKKHDGKAGYENMYSFAKPVYLDDDNKVTESFDL